MQESKIVAEELKTQKINPNTMVTSEEYVKIKADDTTTTEGWKEAYHNPKPPRAISSSKGKFPSNFTPPKKKRKK